MSAVVGRALATGLLAGPLLPHDLVPQAYASSAWIVRLAFFVGIGCISSWTVAALRDRTVRLQRMYANVTRLSSRTLRGFAQALEMKDEETASHCERVATNARLVATRLGLGRDEREVLYWAGYLHDIGKLSTPSSVLTKPGALTFAPIAQGVRCHHERWDGSGYPDGLAGRDIPVAGRMLAVTDVFEALTSARPYRDAWREGDAATWIREGAGSLDADEIHVDARHGHRPSDEPPVFDSRVLESRLSPGTVAARATRRP